MDLERGETGSVTLVGKALPQVEVASGKLNVVCARLTSVLGCTSPASRYVAGAVRQFVAFMWRLSVVALPRGLGGEARCGGVPVGATTPASSSAEALVG